MDVRIEGERLGLGTNLYSDEPTLIEQYGLSECTLQLNLPSAFMDRMSGIRITEDLLEEISGYVTISAEELDGGKVRFSLNKLGDYLNYASIKETNLVITDKRSGQQESFLLTPSFENLDDKNQYTFNKIYELKGRDIEDLRVEYYITAEDFEHYKIADLENNREK
jgi:phosphoglycerol transferase